jgi:hypothetical protein
MSRNRLPLLGQYEQCKSLDHNGIRVGQRANAGVYRHNTIATSLQWFVGSVSRELVCGCLDKGTSSLPDCMQFSLSERERTHVSGQRCLFSS